MAIFGKDLCRKDSIRSQRARPQKQTAFPSIWNCLGDFQLSSRRDSYTLAPLRMSIYFTPRRTRKGETGRERLANVLSCFWNRSPRMLLGREMTTWWATNEGYFFSFKAVPEKVFHNSSDNNHRQQCHQTQGNIIYKLNFFISMTIIIILKSFQIDNFEYQQLMSALITSSIEHALCVWMNVFMYIWILCAYIYYSVYNFCLYVLVMFLCIVYICFIR